MNVKKIIPIFLATVSAIFVSSACCHAVDGLVHPEFVRCLGFSDEGNCELEDEKNSCGDKDEDDKENENDKDKNKNDGEDKDEE